MRLAVIGDPVAHSKSPELHTAFLREADIEGTYEAIRVPAGNCRESVERLAAAGYFGLNVTTPLKEEAHALCASLDEIARRSGSVNTLTLSSGSVVGANTDGAGALYSLRKTIDSTLEGKNVMLLGVGPTARAAALALQHHGARVLLWNRTEERARALAKAYAMSVWEAGLRVDAAFSTLPPNAQIPPSVVQALRAAPIVIDANYGPRATLGRIVGRPVVDGFEMLAAQARASFEIWMTQIGSRARGIE